ncbi:TrmH family RNA methyltransferase [Marinimicrobium sp. ARAG 43.8]|uniref:TrmH family RNA methyltransferase n=1 Tax=Marinimicrobium sp. ARAG 43.8 TaxID=3418719 RepID=UPI003CF43E4E
MSRERYEKFKQVLRQRQTDMTLLTDQVHKAQNISAMLRTADAVGMPTIHMVQPHRGRLVYHHTAGGSGRFTGTVVHPDIQTGMQALRQKGLKLYAAHWSDRAIHYREADFTQPFALVMGAEKEGLSDYAAEHADEHLTIPIIGMVESYNVSVAAAIILQEAMHQRIRVGRYDQSLDENNPEVKDTLFRWMHPKMVRYCERFNLPFPELDEDGDIIPPQDPAYRSPR